MTYAVQIARAGGAEAAGFLAERKFI